MSSIKSSPYMEQVLVDLIPAMTSNESSVGIASASSNHNLSIPYYAFDKTINGWYPTIGNQSGQWLKFSFNSIVKIFGFNVTALGSIRSYSFKIQASSDDISYVDVTETITVNGTSETPQQNSYFVDVKNNHIEYRFIRLYILYGTGDNNGNGLNLTELIVYGRT